MSIDIPVGKADDPAVDGHLVEKDAGGPATDRPAELGWQIGKTLNKGIWTGSRKSNGEGVVAIFGITALEEHLLPQGLEGVTPVIAYFADWGK